MPSAAKLSVNNKSYSSLRSWSGASRSHGSGSAEADVRVAQAAGGELASGVSNCAARPFALIPTRRAIVAKSMINVGCKTFNRRYDRWVDATLSEEKEKVVGQIERFCRRY